MVVLRWRATHCWPRASFFVVPDLIRHPVRGVRRARDSHAGRPRHSVGFHQIAFRAPLRDMTPEQAEKRNADQDDAGDPHREPRGDQPAPGFWRCRYARFRGGGRLDQATRCRHCPCGSAGDADIRRGPRARRNPRFGSGLRCAHRRACIHPARRRRLRECLAQDRATRGFQVRWIDARPHRSDGRAFVRRQRWEDCGRGRLGRGDGLSRFRESHPAARRGKQQRRGQQHARAPCLGDKRTGTTWRCARHVRHPSANLRFPTKHKQPSSWNRHSVAKW